MKSDAFAVLIVEPDRARVCRFNIELRGETLWSTGARDLAAQLVGARPQIVAVTGDLSTATTLADDLRRRGIAESVFVITAAREHDLPPTGQIRVTLPGDAAALRPEDLLEHLVSAVLSAQARTPVSPLTGLPGSPVLRTEVERRIAAGDPFVFLYLDIDNFKAFNDVYGFARGDMAIRLLGREVIEATEDEGAPSDLCVHIGGDDFAVVTSREAAIGIAERIAAKFDRQVPDLYSEDARSQGYIEAPSRRGEPSRYPLMTVSIGGVNTAQRHVGSYLELAEIAAEVKSYAKELEGSQFVMDRRRD
jgi:diguanylate cyclase (GGDEF)-like protein